MEFVSRKKVVRITKKMSSYYEPLFVMMFVMVRDDVRDQNENCSYYEEKKFVITNIITNRHEWSRIVTNTSRTITNIMSLFFRDVFVMSS